jgi:intraflagellar transport protein 88
LWQGDHDAALEKAKEAGKRERLLCKQREQNNLSDQINMDLTFAVCFNLAHQYHQSKLYTEAIDAYTQIVKNKQASLARASYSMAARNLVSF